MVKGRGGVGQRYCFLKFRRVRGREVGTIYSEAQKREGILWKGVGKTTKRIDFTNPDTRTAGIRNLASREKEDSWGLIRAHDYLEEGS